MGNIAPLAIVACVILMPLVWLIATFNHLVRVRQQVRESWADIDVELKRRYELIPNLVETVKGYAKHERDVLELVIQLRNKAMANNGPASGQAVDESALQIGMKRLFAVAESYPTLKADPHFLALQQELANCEDRIAAARRFFNGNVREMNQLCDQFPTNLLASAFDFKHATFFELASEAERVVPRVDLSPQSASG
ncbi:MAG TPA: LemA family protein [Lacipirellulaceae bacterium]|jgi:LemA protein|nr:LemA family protein [Lacipirellulaceae bacterium]